MEIIKLNPVQSTLLERKKPRKLRPSDEKAEIRFNYKKKLEYYGYRDDLISKYILEYDPLINL